jgi:hypothetical protein
MASKWQIWYPHIIDSWQGSATIQTFSHAAYRGFHNLIMEQFQAEDGMLPDDDKQLAKLSRLGMEWHDVAGEVREALTADGQGRVYSKTQFELWTQAHGRHLEHVARMEEINKRRDEARNKRRDEARNKRRDEARNEDRNDDATTAATTLGTTETERVTVTETETEKETKTSAAASAPPEPTAMDANGDPLTLPLINGIDWLVPAASCLEWVNAYPAVNVLTELLKMRAWLNANPKNRKTPAGVRKFVVNWLNRSQDSARPTGGNGNGYSNRGQARTDGNREAARRAAAAICNEDTHRAG